MPAPRPMLWPSADPRAPVAALPGDRAAPPPIPPWMRAGHLLPFFAAELMATLGIRLRLRAEPVSATAPDAMADPARLGAIRCPEGRLLLAIDGDAAMELMAAVYGSDRATCPPETVLLSDLAPANASWLAFQAMVRRATARALAQAGAGSTTAEPPVLADAAIPRTHVLPLLLTGPGLQTPMELQFVPAATPAATAAEPAAAPAPPAATHWDRRLQAVSRTVPVPVALELCAQELPLASVMRLGVGDVIPLPRIDRMQMKVAGEPWAEVPMAALASPPADAAASPAQDSQP